MSASQRSLAGLAVAAVLSTMGCGDGGHGRPAADITDVADVEASCADIFEAGTAIDPASIEDGQFCRDAEGDLELVGTASYDCPDGEHVSVYNDWGRGVMPDGVWAEPFPADFTFDDVMAQCR